jgi:TetR/AcrR family transcriptional regulator of autoinduction and epiphytic fitness
MEAIAARAEVSKRTLYKHFPCKQLLFDAVVDLMLERISPLAELTYDPTRPFATQLQEIAGEEMQMICDPDFISLSRIVLIECMRSDAEAERLMQKFSNVECGLFGWFASAGAAGALGKLDPRLAADMFIALLKGLAYWPQAVVRQPAPDTATRKRIIAEACAMIEWRIAAAV